MHLLPGRMLQGRYLLLRPLGQGGMGAVYLATDQRLGHEVAVKESLVEGAALEQAFLREARLLAGLRHAGLPVVTDFFAEEGRQYLVMQFIPGEDLAGVVARRGPLPEGEVQRLAAELLQTLAFLHGQQPPIIHRDIKPQNLKLTPRGELLLLDFGLAKRAEASRSVYGYSPGFAPLEQIHGSGTDERSDLFSAAATLYLLSTGSAPPPALQRSLAVAAGQADPLVPPRRLQPGLSAALSLALCQGLALLPDQRPQSAAALQALLREAPAATVVLPGPAPCLDQMNLATYQWRLRGPVDAVVVGELARQLFQALAQEHAYQRCFQPLHSGVIQLRHLGASLQAAIQAAVTAPTRGTIAYLTADHVVCYHGYEAPEFVAQGELSAAADVFSLGAILGCLLLGRAPDPRQPRSLLSDLTTSGAPPALLAVLTRALHPTPALRPSAAEALALLGQLPVVVAPSAWAPVDLPLEGARPGPPPGFFDGVGFVGGVASYPAELRPAPLSGAAIPALCLRDRGAAGEFGAVMQRVPAWHLAGRRVRLSGTLGCRDVEEWGGIWLRIDGPGRTLFFDNMNDRALKGTQGLRSCVIETALPPETQWLSFGLVLSGRGLLFAAGLSVDLQPAPVAAWRLWPAEESMPKT